MTLLDIVKSTLSSMNSDDVNDIADTVESTQVALVAKEVYLDLMSQTEWPHLLRDGELDGLGDVNKPNFMEIPNSVYRIKEIKYDVTETGDANKTFRRIEFEEPAKFTARTDAYRTGESNVIEVTTSNSTTMFVLTDDFPRFWTTFDNNEVVFNSYNVAEDTTLQASKSKCLFYELPTWTASNTAIPDIDERFFPGYLAEVKRTCHQYFRQQPSIIDEQRARRGLAMLRQEARRVEGSDTRANYGRR